MGKFQSNISIGELKKRNETSQAAAQAARQQTQKPKASK